VSNKFRVQRQRGVNFLGLHPWLVVTPGHCVVWRAANQRDAFAIAHMFARRRLLQEAIKAEGLSVRQPDFTLVHP
jgi:hypothetical protein